MPRCRIGLAVAAVGAVTLVVLPPAPALGAGGTSGTVTGTVFRDYSADGERDALEPGESGIVVTAYDADGDPVGTATTATNGTYTLNVSGAESTDVRVEFAIPPAKQGYLQSAPLGIDSDGAVAFTALGAAGVDYGVHNPTEYCQANPTLVTACQAYGHQQGAVSASANLRSFPYAATGSEFGGDATATAASVATHAQTGTTFALEYARTRAELFSAAYHKQYAGYGPGGPGAIYKTVGGVTSVLATIPNAGTDARSAYPVNATMGMTTGDTWLTDSSFDSVGKMSLGDMALTHDESTLWVVNLNDRSLYPVTVATGAVGTPVAIPLATGATVACAAADVRPFALARNDASFYVGITCSAQSTQAAANLRLYVYRFDPVAQTFSAAPVFEADFGTPADHGRAGNGCNTNSGTWRPWSTTDLFQAGTECAYPQPMLVSLAFDRGNLILGIRDRFGDQSGADYPVSGGGTAEGVIAGDVLRACGWPTAGWVLEANGACGGITTAGATNAQGPGGGEYYFHDRFSAGTNHQETSNGGLLQVPGFNEIVYTAMDPDLGNGSNWRAGGVHYDRNDTGANDHWFQLYDKCDTSNLSCPSGRSESGMFGKANGLGDLVALCDMAPIEIGNRVWLDANTNGRQDAGEPSLAGVPVTLYAADGVTVVATTSTASDGSYAFSSDPTRTDATGRDYGVTALVPGASVVVHAPVTRTDPTYGALRLTSPGSVAPSIDSNVATATGKSSAVTLGGPGHNDHTIDIGYTPAAAVGNYVWIDTNRDGVQNEPAANGVNGVTVTLQTAAGGPVTDLAGNPVGPLVTANHPTTGAPGYYLFDHLPPGSYRVVFSGLPAGYVPTGSDAGGDDATDSDGLTTAAVTVPAGTADLTLDLGLVTDGSAPPPPDPNPPTGSVVCVVYVDTNRNGRRDPGEVPMPGVTVELVDAAGNVVATTTTDAEGNCRFDGVPPGSYTLRQTQPSGYGSTTPNVVTVDVVAGAVTADPGFGEVIAALPRTGAGQGDLLRMAALLMITGGLLVALGRRPVPRAR